MSVGSFTTHYISVRKYGLRATIFNAKLGHDWNGMFLHLVLQSSPVHWPHLDIPNEGAFAYMPVVSALKFGHVHKLYIEIVCN